MGSSNLAKQQQHSPSSQDGPTSRSDLTPATAKAGEAELLACLVLTAPSGMTAEDRSAWVAVARQTLSGIPGDLLQRGCRKARETCRFPSEIVPAILSEVKVEWERRKRNAEHDRKLWENRNAPRLEKPDYVGAEAIRELLKNLSVGQ